MEHKGIFKVMMYLTTKFCWPTHAWVSNRASDLPDPFEKHGNAVWIMLIERDSFNVVREARRLVKCHHLYLISTVIMFKVDAFEFRTRQLPSIIICFMFVRHHRIDARFIAKFIRFTVSRKDCIIFITADVHQCWVVSYFCFVLIIVVGWIWIKDQILTRVRGPDTVRFITARARIKLA